MMKVLFSPLIECYSLATVENKSIYGIQFSPHVLMFLSVL